MSKAGKTPLSETTLRTWMKVVKGIKPLAFQALKGIAESNDPTLDLSPITKGYLSNPTFIQLSEHEQELNLEVLAR